MELPEPTARNALRLLQYLSERERRPELGLPEIPEISESVELTQDETSDLIDILDSEGAIRANRSIDGGAAPMLTGHGKLLLEVLSDRLGETDTQTPAIRDTKPWSTFHQRKCRPGASGLRGYLTHIHGTPNECSGYTALFDHNLIVLELFYPVPVLNLCSSQPSKFLGLSLCVRSQRNINQRWPIQL